MLNLITDRKQSDVTRAKTLIEKAKRIENLTPSELSEYLAGLKGCYNISDLNRVESAVKYVSNLLKSYNYPNTVSVKTWVEGELFNPSHVNRYLNNLNVLKNAYFVKSTTPTTPSSYKSPQQANNIEKILLDLEEIIKGTINNFIISGVGSVGNNRMRQQNFRRTYYLESLRYNLDKYKNTMWSETIGINKNFTGSKTSNLNLAVMKDTEYISSVLNGYNQNVQIIDSIVGEV